MLILVIIECRVTSKVIHDGDIVLEFPNFRELSKPATPLAVWEVDVEHGEAVFVDLEAF